MTARHLSAPTAISPWRSSPRGPYDQARNAGGLATAIADKLWIDMLLAVEQLAVVIDKNRLGAKSRATALA